jgi:hypothetical protein
MPRRRPLWTPAWENPDQKFGTILLRRSSPSELLRVIQGGLSPKILDVVDSLTSVPFAVTDTFFLPPFPPLSSRLKIKSCERDPTNNPS